MFSNYLKIAYRQLLKNKSFSLINLSGLAIGMASCILIFQYVAYELSYDTFYEDGDNLYRLRYDAYKNGVLQFKSAASVPAAGSAIKNEFPEVLEMSRIASFWGGNMVIYFENPLRINKVFFAEPSFLSMFSISLIKGDKKTALNNVNTAVISETTARKLFGDNDPIGQIIETPDPYLITGVFLDMPENSHIKYNILISFASLTKSDKEAETSWTWDDFYTYLLLKPGSDPGKLEAKFPALLDKYAPNIESKLSLQAVKDIHLFSDLQIETEENSNGRMVYFFMLIAIFILIIAWINYINLTTARSLDRAKETCLRKINGALRFQLIKQFLFESILVNLISVTLAITIVQFLSIYFENFTGKAFSYSVLFKTWHGWFLVVIYFLGVFLSGLYPALILSSYKSFYLFRGNSGRSVKGITLRKLLVIIQFTSSITLVAGVILVQKQLSYMRNFDLGIPIDQTLIVNGPQVTDSLYSIKNQTLKAELLKLNQITDVCASASIPGREIHWTQGVRREEDDPDNYTRVFSVPVDYDFLDTYDMKFLAGRTFSRDFGADRTAVVLNKAATELLQYNNPLEAIDRKLAYGSRIFNIIGVVDNYHHLSLKTSLIPIVFRLFPDEGYLYSLKIKTEDLDKTISMIKDKYDLYFPGNLFEYYFLDEYFDIQYKHEKQFGKIYGFFTLLAIFITCLGLFGLSSYSTVQRTKEVGIRKVLGASGQSVFVMITKDFFRLIMIAVVISMPVGYLIMSNWLQNYMYKVKICWWFFLLPAILSMLIAIISVSYQVFKTANTNPAKSLRYE